MNHFDEEARRRYEEKRRIDELEARRLEFEARSGSQEAQRQRLLDQYRRGNQTNLKLLEQEKKRAALRKKEDHIKLAQKNAAEKKKKEELGTDAMQRALQKRATPEEARATFAKAKRVFPPGLRISTAPGANRAALPGGNGCLLMFAIGFMLCAGAWMLLSTYQIPVRG